MIFYFCGPCCWTGDISEKDAVVVGEELIVAEKATDGEKPEGIEEKVDSTPVKSKSEDTKEQVVVAEEIPAPGIVLTTKRTKSSKVSNMWNCSTSCGDVMAFPGSLGSVT